jgi:multidrug resistance efflux pump
MGRVTHLWRQGGRPVKAGQFLLQIDPVNAGWYAATSLP